MELICDVVHVMLAVFSFAEKEEDANATRHITRILLIILVLQWAIT